MARVYHRDQPGVPVIPYNSGQGGVAHFAALKVVLKACLVSGYGSTPAAGWSLIAEGTNYIVLRNGSASGYVGITWVAGASGLLRVYLLKTFTGMSGDIPQGDGLKSGTAAALGAPQGVASQSPFYASDSSSWYVVADSKTAVIAWVGWGANMNLDNGFNGVAGHTLYIGEDSSGNVISVGGGNSSVDSGNNSVYGGLFGGAGFTALVNPLTGLLVGSGAISVYMPGFPPSISGGRQDVIAKAPSATLSKASWYGDAAYGGTLRGIACCSEIHLVGWTSYAAQCLGRAGAMAIRDHNSPVDLGDAYTYFLRVGDVTSTPAFLVTDNPEFW